MELGDFGAAGGLDKVFGDGTGDGAVAVMYDEALPWRRSSE